MFSVFGTRSSRGSPATWREAAAEIKAAEDHYNKYQHMMASDYERTINWSVVTDMRDQWRDFIYGGAAAEVEAAISTLETHRAAVEAARELEERRWSAKLLEEEQAPLERQVAQILASAPSAMFGQPDRATQLARLREQASRGDEHRRRGVLEALRSAELSPAASIEERQAVHHIAADAGRDLDKLRETPLIVKTIGRERDAQVAVRQSLTAVDLAADVLGEQNPASSMWPSPQLLRVVRRVGEDDAGNVVIFAKDSVEVTGIVQVDPLEAFAATQGG